MADVAEKTRVRPLRPAAAPAPAPARARDGGPPAVEAPPRPAAPAPAIAAEAPPPAAPAKAGGRRKRLRWALLIAGPLVVVAASGWYWLTGGRTMATDNAYVQADTSSVATDVAGLVAAVEVQDNQQVRAGQVLFRLDDTMYRTSLDRMDAELKVTRANLEAFRASYAQKQADIARGESDISFYQKEFDRVQDLVNRRVSAEAQLDAASHNLDASRSSLEASKQQLAGIAAQLDGNPAAPVEEFSQYKAALAARDRAARDLEHTVVRAMTDGIVAQVSGLQPGEYLAAGQAAFALIATDHVWVEANPKETDLTYVRPDQPATIRVDTYPDHVWQGALSSLSPGSQAVFSLLPAQNTSGNWVKVVQRIPVRIRVDTKPGEPQLRAGMSAEIEVDTGHQRHLSDLFSWL